MDDDFRRRDLPVRIHDPIWILCGIFTRRVLAPSLGLTTAGSGPRESVLLAFYASGAVPLLRTVTQINDWCDGSI